MNNIKNKTVCVVGCGYVGLPLAKALVKHVKVIGLDKSNSRIANIIKENNNTNLTLTSDPIAIKQADFVIICVPTPVTESKEPDLTPVINATRAISQNLKTGAIVILESTVYPGVTEELLVPVLEESGLKAGTDFKVAYSPERINPGDEEHGVEQVTKVVAGMDAETTEAVAALYSLVTPHIFKAANIKTAEAAKVIENTQRDLNIALMNELAMLFNRMGLDTRQVLDAASTKWNFNRYSPGLVGGHCIPVDPYYLVHKARELGFEPKVIAAGRKVNDGMPKYIAGLAVQALESAGKLIRGSKVVVMGLTYKENVPDLRETPAMGIITELVEYRLDAYGYDPLLTPQKIEQTFNIPALTNLTQIEALKPDCLIFTVGHKQFLDLSIYNLVKITNTNPVLVDVRSVFDSEAAKNAGFIYRAL
ncbi:MAG: nucleotide sugar dehydrogenase [Dehalococcoidaceae bacterium]|nr:nucleotide sugar dehydrogenase [Dehalococcoidaceae bacterium]